MTSTLALIARLVVELDAERRGAQFLASEVERAWRDGMAEGMRRATTDDDHAPEVEHARGARGLDCVKPFGQFAIPRGVNR